MRLVSKLNRANHARQFLAFLLAGCFSCQQVIEAAAPTTTLPAGGTYVGGSGSIKSSGNAVTINQSSLRGIIDWNTFSLGQTGSVTFRNGNGATLNRVTGGQMSSILGSLFASGSVYVIDPQGVLVGPGAHVYTGGDFVASTLNISNQNFLAGGSLLFQGDSKNVVVNLGDIFSKNGSVFLIGHGVGNEGRVSASRGTAGLAAGSEVLLKDSTGDQRVFVQAAGADVTNTGSIAAAQAELRAKGGNVYALAGNNSDIAATGTATIDGKAWLISDGGKTLVTGTVSARNANGISGSIETSGHDLDISHATVKTGQGGNWLLDPVDVLIDSPAASTIQNSLGTTNVTVQTTATAASGPGTQTSGNGDITVGSNIAWSSGNSLTLSAYNNVNVNTGITISNTGAGNLTLRADNTSSGTGVVNLNGTSKLDWSQSTGSISALYNPVAPVINPNPNPNPSPDAGLNQTLAPNTLATATALGTTIPLTSGSKYTNPINYSPNISTNSAWTAPANKTISSQSTAYMLVNNASDLQDIGSNATGTYALGANINASSIPNFTPLNSNGNGFNGILDGMGQTISNLTVHSGFVSIGMFAQVNPSGIVRNLNLTGVDVQATAGDPPNLGALAGTNSGTIANITVSGLVKNQFDASKTGGVIGEDDASATIQNVVSSATVDASVNTSGGAAVGGLVGSSLGSITNSSASGSVNGGKARSIGGLSGMNTAAITNSSASGFVLGANRTTSVVGGLIGNNAGPITGSYATGATTNNAGGYSSAGGLMGTVMARVRRSQTLTQPETSALQVISRPWEDSLD